MTSPYIGVLELERSNVAETNRQADVLSASHADRDVDRLRADRE